MSANHIHWLPSHDCDLYDFNGAFCTNPPIEPPDVNIKSGRDAKVTKAAIGLRVFPTDTIITGKDSRAKILMVDKNEINISPDSEIVLQKYVYDPSAGKKEVLLNVLSGKVRAKVEQKYNGTTAKFQVKTPSAVAGVRGTDFLTSFDSSTKQSSVVTFHGHVEFGQPGAGGTIQNPVMVDPGQTSTVAVGTAASAPVEMPKKELASMDKESNADTATAGTSNSSDSRQPTSDEKKKEEGKDDGAKKDEGAKKEDSAKKEDGAKKEDSSKSDTAKKEDSKSEGNKSDNAKNEGNKSEGNKSADGSKSEGTKTAGTKTEGAKTEGPKAGNGGSNSQGGNTAANGGGSTGASSNAAGGSMNPDKSPVTGGSATSGTAAMNGADRMPATATTGTSMPGKSDMFNPGDLAGAGGAAPMPVVGPALPVLPPTIPQTNMPACDFCNQTIQNGNTKLLININTQ